MIETTNIEAEQSKLLSLLKDNLNENKKELLYKIHKIDLIHNELEIQIEKNSNSKLE